jgi:hypothetical protein
MFLKMAHSSTKLVSIFLWNANTSTSWYHKKLIPDQNRLLLAKCSDIIKSGKLIRLTYVLWSTVKNQQTVFTEIWLQNKSTFIPPPIHTVWVTVMSLCSSQEFELANQQESLWRVVNWRLFTLGIWYIMAVMYLLSFLGLSQVTTSPPIRFRWEQGQHVPPDDCLK